MDKAVINNAIKSLTSRDEERGTSSYIAGLDEVMIQFRNGQSMRLSDNEIYYQSSLYVTMLEDEIRELKS